MMFRDTPPSLRRAVLARDKCCQACGSSENMAIDHVRPQSAGGSDDAWNLQVLCKPCNSSKGDGDSHEWLSSGRWRSRFGKVARRSEFKGESRRVFTNWIIDQWPERAALARDVGLPEVNVRMWAYRGSIPARYWPALADAAARRGFDAVTFNALASAYASAMGGPQ